MSILELNRRLASEAGNVTPFVSIETFCDCAPADYLVWWGCLCSWATWRPVPPPVEDQSLAIASCWVFTGDDSLRDDAAIRSEMPDSGACKWLLKAIAHSGVSVVNNGKSANTVAPDVCGRFVFGFIHQLLSIHTTVNRSAAAETFVQFARQSLNQPLPRSATTSGRPLDHDQ